MTEMKQSHSSLTAETKQHQPSTRVFRCGVCTADFPTLNTCIAHMKNHAAESETVSQVDPPATTSTVQLRATPLSPTSGSDFLFSTGILPEGQSPTPTTNPSVGIGTSVSAVGGQVPKVTSPLTAAGSVNTASPDASLPPLTQNPTSALPKLVNTQQTVANSQKYVVATQPTESVVQQNLTSAQQTLTMAQPNQANVQQNFPTAQPSLKVGQRSLTMTHQSAQQNMPTTQLISTTAPHSQVIVQQNLTNVQGSCVTPQQNLSVVQKPSFDSSAASDTSGDKSANGNISNLTVTSKPPVGTTTSAPLEIVVDKKNYKLVSFPTSTLTSLAGNTDAPSLQTAGTVVSDAASTAAIPHSSNAATACSKDAGATASAETTDSGTLNLLESSLVRTADVKMNSSSLAVASTYSPAVIAADAPQGTVISITIPPATTTATTTAASLPGLTSKRKNILVHDDHFGTVDMKLKDAKPETQGAQQWSQQGQADGSVAVCIETATSSDGEIASSVVKSEVNLNNWTAEERDKPYLCPVAGCGARYRFLSSLSVHRKRHAGVRPYQCKICSKRFWHPTNLRVHERVHSKVRLFQCTECGHGFNQANDLRIHMRIHTGELPLKCPVLDCDRAFRDPACFRRHMSKHAGVQPHLKCDSCTARFYHLSALNRHHRKHTGEKDYVCPTCGSAFARADTLKLHQRGHSGHKPYMCSACQMLFADRSYCRRHVAKHDDEQNASVVVLAANDMQYQPFVIKQEPMEVGDGENEAGAAVGVEEKAETMHLQPPPPPPPPPQPTASVLKKQQKGPTVVPLRIPNPPGSDIPYASIEIEIPGSDLAGGGNENDEKGGDENEDIVYQYGDMLITISRSAVKELEGGVGDMVEAKADNVAEWLQGQELVSVDPAAAAAPFYNQQVEHQYSRGIDAEGIRNGRSPPETISSSVEVTAAASAETGTVVGQQQQQPLSEYNQIVSSLIKTEPVESGKEEIVRGVTVSRERQKMPRVGERRWPCPDCDASYFHQAELKRHRTKHTGEMPYQCNVCLKRIRDPSNLKRHLRTHTGDRPYRCQVCHKHFSQAGHLTAHFRIHTGERPYKCEQCPSTFIEANHLRYHKKMHAGIKEFKCSQCDLSFIRNAELKRHVKVHGGERPFQCELCPANYFRLDALKLHCTIKHRQSQQKPFQCPSCPLSFTKQTYLHRHMQRANHHHASVTVDEKNRYWIKEEAEEEQDVASKAPASDHNSVVADAENSVVANALCELATGVRSAALINVNGSNVVSSSALLETDSKSVQGSPLSSKAKELAKVLTAKKKIKQADHRESTTLTMEEEELTTEVNNDEIFVQKVMVEGGSVLGARAVLVASDQAIEVTEDSGSATYHTLDDDSKVNQGVGSVGKKTFVVDTATGKTLDVVESMPELRVIEDESKVVGEGLKLIGEEFKVVGERIIGEESKVIGGAGNSKNVMSSYIVVGSGPQVVTENPVCSRSSPSRLLIPRDSAGRPVVSTIQVNSGIIATPSVTTPSGSSSTCYIHVSQGLAVDAEETYATSPTKLSDAVLETSSSVVSGNTPSSMHNLLVSNTTAQTKNQSVAGTPASGQILLTVDSAPHSKQTASKQMSNSKQAVSVPKVLSTVKTLPTVPSVSRQILSCKQTVQNTVSCQPVLSVQETSGQTPGSKQVLAVMQTPVSSAVEPQTSRQINFCGAKSGVSTSSDSTVQRPTGADKLKSAKSSRAGGQTRKKKVKVEPASEKKDKGMGVAAPTATPESGPVRTRSGRERKIKVKYSA